MKIQTTNEIKHDLHRRQICIRKQQTIIIFNAMMMMVASFLLVNSVEGRLPMVVDRTNNAMRSTDHSKDFAGLNNIAASASKDGEQNLTLSDSEYESEDVSSEDTSCSSTSGVKAAADGYCFGRQSVEDAVAAVERGELVVVVDDEDRENEGDFICSADLITPLSMSTIIRYSSGVVCVALSDERCNELALPPMTVNNEDPKGTAFTVSVDAHMKHGITTGISATERAITIKLLSDPTAKISDFNRPGHIFPLRAKAGGTLERDGHTEAAIDLSKLAKQNPCGVLCEIVSEEHPTQMMRLPEIRRFCKQHGFVLTSIVDIAQYRRETEL